MDLERLKLAKSVKPKRSRDKVNEPVIYLQQGVGNRTKRKLGSSNTLTN